MPGIQVFFSNIFVSNKKWLTMCLWKGFAGGSCLLVRQLIDRDKISDKISSTSVFLCLSADIPSV